MRGLTDDLAEAAGALYLREMRGIADILAEEAALRAGLTRLNAQAAEARSTLPSDAAMQATGAAILWHGWEDRTRRALNSELACVLARKQAALDALRLAHGREQAVLALQAAEAEARRASRVRRAQEALIAGWTGAG